MKEQLINFETAKLAKEKGFFIWCPERYVPNLEKTPWPPIRYKRNGEAVLVDKNQVYAPTQSLLQKWLREVHNIDAWVEPLAERRYGSNVTTDLYSEEEVDLDYKAEDFFTSYEFALEDSLLEALKLIK